ncbi:MAG: TetR/AcrR family transcriptional regulator, partial [Flavobacterium sp.]|nr:TetR/AcrR family transcriptional regulator [Flavobacterium sp.]
VSMHGSGTGRGGRKKMMQRERVIRSGDPMLITKISIEVDTQVAPTKGEGAPARLPFLFSGGCIRINKAMLHYFFRSKEKLFEAVFLNAFGKLAPQVNEIFNSEDPLFEKIEKFVHSYISFVMDYPFLPQFIIQEMNNNPEFVAKFLKDEKRPNPSKLLKQIETEIGLGIIKPISPKQLLLDIFAMTAFPLPHKT